MNLANPPILMLLTALASPLTAQTVATAETDSAEAAANTQQQAAEVVEPVTLNVQFQDQKIRFQQVDGVIQTASVCSNQTKIMDRASCQQLAKKYFNKACRKPPVGTGNDSAGSNKKMYCQAAKSFKPMVAVISAASDESKLQQQRCSSLIVQAINNDNPYVIARRDRECAKL